MGSPIASQTPELHIVAANICACSPLAKAVATSSGHQGREGTAQWEAAPGQAARGAQPWGAVSDNRVGEEPAALWGV